MWVAFLEEMVKEYLPEDSDIWAETETKWGSKSYRYLGGKNEQQVQWLLDRHMFLIGVSIFVN